MANLYLVEEEDTLSLFPLPNPIHEPGIPSWKPFPIELGFLEIGQTLSWCDIESLQALACAC